MTIDFLGLPFFKKRRSHQHNQSTTWNIDSALSSEIRDEALCALQFPNLCNILKGKNKSMSELVCQLPWENRRAEL